jgi:hypothetical protein
MSKPETARTMHARGGYPRTALCKASSPSDPMLGETSFLDWCDAFDALQRPSDATPPCAHCRVILEAGEAPEDEDGPEDEAEDSPGDNFELTDEEWAFLEAATPALGPRHSMLGLGSATVEPGGSFDLSAAFQGWGDRVYVLDRLILAAVDAATGAERMDFIRDVTVLIRFHGDPGPEVWIPLSLMPLAFDGAFKAGDAVRVLGHSSSLYPLQVSAALTLVDADHVTGAH